MQASEFAIIPDAGHFLDLESSAARRAAGEIKREFLFGNQQADRLMSERSDPGAIPMAV
jgi:hypothetical protein